MSGEESRERANRQWEHGDGVATGYAVIREDEGKGDTGKEESDEKE